MQGVRIRDVKSKTMIERIKNSVSVKEWKRVSDFLLCRGQRGRETKGEIERETELEEWDKLVFG